MNIGKLKGIVPDNVLAQLPVIKEIDGPLRMSRFLGQCAHGSGNFTTVFENLSYSADALRKMFGRHFSSEQAVRLAHNHIGIGNLLRKPRPCGH